MSKVGIRWSMIRVCWCTIASGRVCQHLRKHPLPQHPRMHNLFTGLMVLIFGRVTSATDCPSLYLSGCISMLTCPCKIGLLIRSKGADRDILYPCCLKYERYHSLFRLPILKKTKFSCPIEDLIFWVLVFCIYFSLEFFVNFSFEFQVDHGLSNVGWFFM